MDYPSDFICSGCIINPENDQVLVSTGILNAYPISHNLKIGITLYSSAMAEFKLGIFDSSGIPIRTFLFAAEPGVSNSFSIDNISLLNGHQFQVINASSLDGKVSVMINPILIGGV